LIRRRCLSRSYHTDSEICRAAEELDLLARTLRKAVEDFAGLLTTPDAI